jgi:Flp pilus assembly protein TadG
MGRARSEGREEAATAVEMALVLPLLVMLVFGIVQFSLAFARVQGMNAAAREGARVAAIAHSDITVADVEARVREARPPFVDPADLTILIHPEGQPAANGTWCSSTAERVQVTVRIGQNLDRYAVRIPLVPDVSPNYEASGIFRCERERD